MPSAPYMKFYFSDYEGDTHGLSTLQHGIYFLLIKAYWRRGGPLPVDDKELARIAGVDGRTWRREKGRILQFFDVAEQQIVHQRIEKELAKFEAKSNNNKRLGNANAKRTRSDRVANARIYQTSEEGETSSPSHIESSNELSLGDLPSPPDDPDEKYPVAFEAFWQAYPRRTNKRAAAKAYAAAVKRLRVVPGKPPLLPGVVHSTLVARATAQAELWAGEHRAADKIPHAATWLNAGGFSDDAVKAKAKGEKVPDSDAYSGMTDREMIAKGINPATRKPFAK